MSRRPLGDWAKPASIPHPGYELFLRAFPQTEQNAVTRGGTAWRIPIPEGGEILVTEAGNPPLIDTQEVEVGIYDADGDPVDGFIEATWHEAIGIVRRVLSEMATPA